MSALQQYINLYHDASELVCERAVDVLNMARPEAERQFCAFVDSTAKLEDYKYTDYKTLLAPDYGLNLRRLSFSSASKYKKPSCSIAQMDSVVVQMENDVPYISSEDLARLPKGVFVGSFSEAAIQVPQILENYYGKFAEKHSDPLTSLNTLFVQEGLLIFVPSGCKIDRPLQVISTTHSNQPLMCHQRLLVILEDGASLTLLHCDETAATVDTLTTQVGEIVVGRESELQMFLLEETGVQHTRFHQVYLQQDKDSSVEWFDLTLQNGYTRNTLRGCFVGENASLATYGVALASGKQRVDNNLLVRHEVSNCRSTMLYKYVLDDQSVGAFAGKVYVAQGTVKNESEQTNANLCAGNDARAYSQPMLEIYADDVQCSHGSTVGKLDEAALFYMQQRGIPLAEARLMLQHAFVGEVLEHIPIEALRQRLSILTDLRLRGKREKCQGCKAVDACY
ncbi:MAG: Fe-S cluster assembly protein SufD [Alloprevotella sp.]|nr:Fe-S cluster assembly protein SufD [Alloprevotella sp.]